jgi:hypothetical protein
MQTIHLEVKDNYVQNVLNMLNSIKDTMIDEIIVDKSIKDPNDKYCNEDEDLKKLQIKSMSKTWDNEEDKAWDAL